MPFLSHYSIVRIRAKKAGSVKRIGAADTTVTQAFVLDLHFQTGDLLQINCDPAGNSGNLFGHLLLELYF